MEPERGEKSGCRDRRVRRVRRVFHLHRRHSDIVRIRIQSPEENTGGKHIHILILLDTYGTYAYI